MWGCSIFIFITHAKLLSETLEWGDTVSGIKMRRGERRGEGYAHMSPRKGLNEHYPLISCWGSIAHIHIFPVLYCPIFKNAY